MVDNEFSICDICSMTCLDLYKIDSKKDELYVCETCYHNFISQNEYIKEIKED